MPEQEITTTKKTMSMMARQESYVSAIAKGLVNILGNSTDYQRKCGYSMLNAINIALKKDGLDHSSPNVDRESINNAIMFAMMCELDTDNKEVFVIMRNEKRNGNYVKVADYKPQYRGTLKIVAKFGTKVDRVYPEWIVREGDYFKYPIYKGVNFVEPEWTPKGEGKVLRVVVPIRYKDGTIDYRIAERESVATNIKAQIKQSVMYDNANKNKIMTLISDMTLDQLLTNEQLKEYVNDTYTGISQEEMIITKLVINAVKRVAIDFGSAFSREIYEKTFDNADVYKKNHTATGIVEQDQTMLELQHQEIKEIETQPNDEQTGQHTSLPEEVSPNDNNEVVDEMQGNFTDDDVEKLFQ